MCTISSNILSIDSRQNQASLVEEVHEVFCKRKQTENSQKSELYNQKLLEAFLDFSSDSDITS